MFGPLLVGHVVAKERLRACLIGHSGPLLTATKDIDIDIDISDAAVLAKLDLDHTSDLQILTGAAGNRTRHIKCRDLRKHWI